MSNFVKYFCLVLCSLGFLLSGGVQAQSLPSTSVGYSIVAPSVSNAGGAYTSFTAANQTGYAVTSAVTAGTSAGVSVTESGIATFAKAGGADVLKVPVSIVSDVAKSSIAKAAAKGFIAARALAGPVGIAVTAWALYDAYKQSGLHTCPPPDFFCKPVEGTDVEWYGTDAPCSAGMNGNCSIDKVIGQFTAFYTARGYDNWRVTSQGSVSGTDTAIGSARSIVLYIAWDDQGYPMTGTRNVNGDLSSGGTHFLPAGAGDLQQAAQIQMDADASGGVAKHYFDAVTGDYKTMGSSSGSSVGMLTPEDVVPTGSPTTVSSPPFTAPSQIVSTTNHIDANGNPQTQTQTQQITISPKIVPNTSGASTQVAYDIGATTTTSDTHATPANPNAPPTTTTSTANQTSTPVTSLPKEFPTDYNREVTQQAMQKELAGTGAPDMPDQGALVAAVTTKSAADLEQMRNGAAAAQTGASGFFSWAWTPPVGNCSPASGTVHGYSVSWDICPTVLNIKDVLGWIMGIFALVSVYSELFKKGDD